MKFAALRLPWYKGFWAGGSLLMAGDNAEHALTYWVLWQQFHSPLLAGFAVISHWVPHLLLALPFGALADRYDCRRIIQVALVLFMSVSLAWGVLFLTGTLRPWHAVVLLVLHGISGAIWQPASQVMLYDMAGERDIPSAVRLLATGISVGQVAGPALGAVLLFTIGPAIGMFVNALLYVPFIVFLFIIPLDGHGQRREIPRLSPRAVFGTLRELPRYPSILVVMIIQGAVGIFIGTALLPLFPEFAEILGQDTSGVGYGVLIVAMAFGAVVGGLSLESIARIRATSRLAVGGALVFALAVGAFALSSSFALSIAALFIAGVASIVTASTSTTVVQLAAPSDKRGRYIGASNITASGSRAGAGILLGVFGGLFGIPAAVAIDATLLGLVAIALLIVVTTWRKRRDA